MNRILGIVGSPREGGNTEQLMERVLAAAREEGAETILFTCAGKTIAPCQACEGCVRGSVEYCTQDDDMLDLYPRLIWADAVVFGTPVHMGGMTAQLKAVFDRTRPLWRMNKALSNKAVAAVAVGAGRWGGQEPAVQNILSAALNHGMTAHGSSQVCAVAQKPGDIARDTEAIRDAEALGRRLASLSLSLD